jgi:hypothetical protein
MFDIMKSFARSNRYLYFPFYLFRDKLYPKYLPKAMDSLSDYWIKRIDDTLKSPDLDKIEKVNNAGQLHKDYQVMHNGIKINIGSYYGVGHDWYAYHELLKLTGGVHEPQEEYVFQEVLKTLPKNASMLELGCYWSFYSMWFAIKIDNPLNILVEPEPRGIYEGIKNFKLNNLEGQFIQAFISDKVYKSKSSTDTLSVDYILEQKKIKHLHILHSDIQGFEVQMLHGAHNCLSKKMIEFVFISTHSNELHINCLDILSQYKYKVIASANLDESYSYDGLIVAAANQDFSSVDINLR